MSAEGLDHLTHAQLDALYKTHVDETFEEIFGALRASPLSGEVAMAQLKKLYEYLLEPSDFPRSYAVDAFMTQQGFLFLLPHLKVAPNSAMQGLVMNLLVSLFKDFPKAALQMAEAFILRPLRALVGRYSGPSALSSVSAEDMGVLFSPLLLAFHLVVEAQPLLKERFFNLRKKESRGLTDAEELLPLLLEIFSQSGTVRAYDSSVFAQRESEYRLSLHALMEVAKYFFEVNKMVQSFTKSDQSMADDLLSGVGRVDSVPSDGNCFFHAVARGLQVMPGLKEITHEQVRETGIRYLFKHTKEFEPFFDNQIETLYDYTVRMMNPGEWAEQVIVEAVMKAYDVKALIVDIGLDATGGPLHHFIHLNEGANGPQIALLRCYNHYQGLVLGGAEAVAAPAPATGAGSGGGHYSVARSFVPSSGQIASTKHHLPLL